MRDHTNTQGDRDMKLTESQLRRIIREEAARIVREGYDDPGAAAMDAFVSVIETYAQVLLAGDSESSAEQYEAIGPALDHMLENDSSGLTSADVYEMVSSVMGRVFEEGGLDADDTLDDVKNIDQDFIEPAFMSPTAEPAPAPMTRAALRKVLGGAGKAAEKLRKGMGPKNFDVNETLRRRLGR